MIVANKTPLRRVLRWSCLPLLAIVAWCLFRLFEPVFTWSSGWSPLPEISQDTLVHAVDSDWSTTDAQADALLIAARNRLDAPALSAAIQIDGQRVWASAIGFADVTKRGPVTINSRFRLGSTSKMLNGLLIARLGDESKIDIDRPIRAYLPDLPATYDGINTRMAMTHTAGIPDYALCLCFPVWEHKNRRHFDSVRAALHVFEDRPLLVAPGSGFHYSSYGANLAGAAAEAATKTPYRDLLATTVFAPLGMSNSRFDVAGIEDPQRVLFYEVTEGKFKLADPVDNSIRYPSGGMLSTPTDMLNAGQALIDGDFLSDMARRRMLTPQKLADGSDNPQAYALGIRVYGDKKLFKDTLTTTFYTHHGTAVGSTSYFAIYPEYGLVISVMMNKGQENLDAMGPEAQRLVELFVAEKIRRRGLVSSTGTAASP